MPAPATNTVAWFDIGAPDIDAAKAFYGPLFGWSFAPDGAYTLITAPGVPGPSGGIFNTGGNIPPYAVSLSRSQTSPRPPPRPRTWAARSSCADGAGGRHGRRLPHRPQRQHVRLVQPQARQLSPSQKAGPGPRSARPRPAQPGAGGWASGLGGASTGGASWRSGTGPLSGTPGTAGVTAGATACSRGAPGSALVGGQSPLLPPAPAAAREPHILAARALGHPRTSLMTWAPRDRGRASRALTRSATNPASASARACSSRARRIEDGWTVLSTGPRHSPTLTSSTWPRWSRTLNPRPKIASPATAPRATVSRGLTTASSASSQPRQAMISVPLGRW